MKTFIYAFLVLSFPFCLISQSNLSIFNNGDYAFHIMLNGIKQNQFPQKNVTISNISSGGHALKVVFANGASADIDKKLYLNEPSDIRMSIEFKKGVGKLKIISYEPTKGAQVNSLAFRPNDSVVYGDAPITNQNQQTVQNQETILNNASNSSNINSSSNSSMNNSNNSTTTVTTTTTNSLNQTPTNGNINVSIGMNETNTNTSNQTTSNGNVNLNIDGSGMNMNVVDPLTGQGINMNVNMNMSEVGNSNTNTQSHSSTTVTTTSTSITTTGQSNQISTPNNQTISNSNSNNSAPNQNNSIKGSARINCSKVLSNFDNYLNGIKELSFESDQVEAIKKDLEFTCVTSIQAFKIVEILTFESNRLDIAKYLSDRMSNRDKAGELIELFTFESNKVEYKNYIR
jgi:hypothetical protein